MTRCTDNLVQGNLFGTALSGGVQVDQGAANNTIGGLITPAGVFQGFDFASATSAVTLSLRKISPARPTGKPAAARPPFTGSICRQTEDCWHRAPP